MARVCSRIALAVLVLVTPVMVWAVLPIGEVRQGQSDQNVKPLAIASGTKISLAIVSVGLALLAIGVVALCAGRSPTLGADIGVAVPLVAAVGYPALTFVVLTQPVGGANIGGGIMFLFGCLFVPTMLVVSAALAGRVHRIRSPRARIR